MINAQRALLDHHFSQTKSKMKWPFNWRHIWPLLKGLDHGVQRDFAWEKAQNGLAVDCIVRVIEGQIE